MIIYRFERHGIGPYVGGTRVPAGRFYKGKTVTRTQKKYSIIFNNISRQTSLQQRLDTSYKAHTDKNYLFGCSSKEMLRAYFCGNFKSLFREGYRIKRYSVPDDQVLNMGTEVAFPVKYHKLQTVIRIKEKSPKY